VKALRAQGGLNQQFLPHLLVANRQRLLGMVDAAGHGTGRLNTDELKSLIVTYPHESEQMRIASCLANLEFLIPTHKDKLEALKTHKQGLCHQLFPS
jgi:type I restriction enzyme S subunit